MLSSDRKYIIVPDMRRICIAVIAFAFVVILVAPGQSQTTSSSGSKPRTVWVPPRTGSLIGGGFADAGDDMAASKSTAATRAGSGNAALGNAIAELDAQSPTTVEGWTLIAAAVANQAGVPVRTLKAQRTSSKLTYGELLVANSLSSGSGKSFEDVVAMHGKGRNWGQMAKEFHIQVDSITARVRAASDSIKFAENRRNLRREQNIKQTGLDAMSQRSRHPAGP